MRNFSILRELTNLLTKQVVTFTPWYSTKSLLIDTLDNFFLLGDTNRIAIVTELKSYIEFLDDFMVKESVFDRLVHVVETHVLSHETLSLSYTLITPLKRIAYSMLIDEINKELKEFKGHFNHQAQPILESYIRGISDGIIPVYDDHGCKIDLSTAKGPFGKMKILSPFFAKALPLIDRSDPLLELNRLFVINPLERLKLLIKDADINVFKAWSELLGIRIMNLDSVRNKFEKQLRLSPSALYSIEISNCLILFRNKFISTVRPQIQTIINSIPLMVLPLKKNSIIVYVGSC